MSKDSFASWEDRGLYMKGVDFNWPHTKVVLHQTLKAHGLDLIIDIDHSKQPMAHKITMTLFGNDDGNRWTAIINESKETTESYFSKRTLIPISHSGRFNDQSQGIVLEWIFEASNLSLDPINALSDLLDNLATTSTGYSDGDGYYDIKPEDFLSFDISFKDGEILLVAAKKAKDDPEMVFP
jgi:hypothetical protein